MKTPSVRDDGQRVSLDLHGATIRNAIILLRRTLMVSAARGRSTVRVIHGYSTSVNPRVRTSIRDELNRLLDEGSLSEVQNYFRLDGATILSLRLCNDVDRRPITIRDITDIR